MAARSWSRPASTQMLARTERAHAGRRSAAIPDGRYRFADVMDGDGIDALDIPIAVEVTVDGERIRFDFAGTAPQVPGSINVTLNATRRRGRLRAEGAARPRGAEQPGHAGRARGRAPSRARWSTRVFPAPVSSRAHTSQRIIDVVLGALAQALPERAVAAANGANSMAVFAGTDPRTGRPFVYLETLGGGMGGRPMKDGKDGVQVGITNTSNLPVEAIELEYPLLVEEYSLIPDSGGAGTHRGGLGLRRVVRPLGQTCLFNGVGERFRHQPWGLSRRGARRVRAVPDRRARRHAPADPRQARRDQARPGAGAGGRDAGRRRLRPAVRAQRRGARRGPRERQVHGRLHAAPLRRRLS